MKSRTQMKADLMARLEEAVERMLVWRESHQTFTMTELEDFVLSLRESVGQEIATEVLGQMESKTLVEAGCCERCGRPLEYKGQEKRRLVTRIGEIDVERGRYWCPECKAGFFPPG